MLLVTSRNWNGLSAIKIEDNKATPVMYMNASYNGTDTSFNESIPDMELYNANKTMCDEDLKKFHDEVLYELSIINKEKTNEVEE